MSTQSNHNYCLNCGAAYPEGRQEEKQTYCLDCGQSSKDSRLSMLQLLKDGLSNIFNLDSRLVHTFRDIFLPSRLTRTYIEGKRKYYVNPARLFVFLLIALVSLLLITVELENTQFGVDRFYADAEKSMMMDSYRKLADTVSTPQSAALLDTINERLFADVTDIREDTIGQNLNLFAWDKQVKDYGISSYDALHMQSGQLFKKYQVTGFWQKLIVGQHIKIVTNPAGSIAYAIKNFTWTVILTILFMSFVLKLLYIRKPYYIVEHAVLLLNAHSLVFVIAIANILIFEASEIVLSMDEVSTIIINCSIALTFILQFLTLKKYYMQGVIKTLIKQILINSIYLTIFLSCLITVAIISVLLY